MAINFTKARELLHDFNFATLFIEELGWQYPSSERRPTTMQVDGQTFTRTAIAQLGGAVVFEVVAADGAIPDAKLRKAIHKAVAAIAHENLLIFVDHDRTQSCWYWVKRVGSESIPRQPVYMRGQPGDLFLIKLDAMFVDIGELDEQGSLPIIDVARRLQQALDVEVVTKRFFSEFQQLLISFVDLIEGIDGESDRRWYASILLNRLMFIYFLQRKGFVDDDTDYLSTKLQESKQRGAGRYYGEFLATLFFEGFAKPEDHRSPEARRLLGNVRYLNGGLFLKHKLELTHPHIAIPDQAFENLLALFRHYSWNLNDTPGGQDNEINPDVLGYIFEKYINQKEFGAYYTRPEITQYLCEHTIQRIVLDRVNHKAIPGVAATRHFDSVAELLMRLDAPLCRELLEILPSLTLLDPACGSGAFLVAAMKTLIDIYSAVLGRIKFLNDDYLTAELTRIEKHRSVAYHIKKQIITNNLFGVDIMEEATEIAKLRLFLALVSSAQTVDQLEPLPNIDFNVMAGNSLVGLLKVEESKMRLFYGKDDYHRILDEKNRLVQTYRDASTYSQDLRLLRDHIESVKADARSNLDNVLLQDFLDLKIKYEQAQTNGKPDKRNLTVADIQTLEPFHWGYEFDEILQEQRGFDAIITNPPWEIFKPQAKEFLAVYSNTVTKNAMRIEDFEKELAAQLRNPRIEREWLEYQSRFPHLSAFFRNAAQYRNQISVVDGKKAGTDINLYKLFTEQCFNLLRPGGYCGIVIPSGIYSDLGTKQLRELLFDESEITGLFCFENRKSIFEGVDSRFKFVVLTFEKGSTTSCFPAAFMRHDVADLTHFPQTGSMPISVDLVRRLSPDSLSVIEFQSEIDVRIVEKMLRFPLLGDRLEESWNLALTAEFHMTNDSRLFKPAPGSNRGPLYEGKMIHQFRSDFAAPRYWVDRADARAALLSARLGRITRLAARAGLPRGSKESAIQLDMDCYRSAHRAIASSTNERTLIAAIVPPGVVCGNSLHVSQRFEDVLCGGKVVPTLLLDDAQLLFLVALLNSFVVDYSLRLRIAANLSMFYIYQLAVPRFGPSDRGFNDVVQRAAKLVCITPEYDDLARQAGLESHRQGVTTEVQRAELRAELDGMIAHLYGLTEDEFAHVLGTFPLVPEPVKVAARNAYRDVERGLIA